MYVRCIYINVGKWMYFILRCMTSRYAANFGNVLVKPTSLNM